MNKWFVNVRKGCDGAACSRKNDSLSENVLCIECVFLVKNLYFRRSTGGILCRSITKQIIGSYRTDWNDPIFVSNDLKSGCWSSSFRRTYKCSLQRHSRQFNFLPVTSAHSSNRTSELITAKPLLTLKTYSFSTLSRNAFARFRFDWLQGALITRPGPQWPPGHRVTQQHGSADLTIMIPLLDLPIPRQFRYSNRNRGVTSAKLHQSFLNDFQVVALV